MMLLPLLVLIFGLDTCLTRAHIMERTTSRHMSRLVMIGGNLKYGYGASRELYQYRTVLFPTLTSPSTTCQEVRLIVV